MSKLCCEKCGGAKFVQKQIIRTGVTVVDGVVTYCEPYPSPPMGYLFCMKCGTVLPPNRHKGITASRNPLALVQMN